MSSTRFLASLCIMLILSDLTNGGFLGPKTTGGRSRPNRPSGGVRRTYSVPSIPTSSSSSGSLAIGSRGRRPLIVMGGPPSTSSGGSSTSLSTSRGGSSTSTPATSRRGSTTTITPPPKTGFIGKVRGVGKTVWDSGVPQKTIETFGTAMVGSAMFAGGQFAYDAIKGEEPQVEQPQVIVYPFEYADQQSTQMQQPTPQPIIQHDPVTDASGEAGGDGDSHYSDEYYYNQEGEEELPAIY